VIRINCCKTFVIEGIFKQSNPIVLVLPFYTLPLIIALSHAKQHQIPFTQGMLMRQQRKFTIQDGDIMSENAPNRIGFHS
jgi:hypothetical protein